VIASGLLAEANDAEMVFNDGLSGGGIFEPRAAAARTSGNRNELHSDGIDSFLQAHRVPRVERVECSSIVFAR
jgi:hypothetical protein